MYDHVLNEAKSNLGFSLLEIEVWHTSAVVAAYDVSFTHVDDEMSHIHSLCGMV
jgi:hypothetical protein